jgi:uncharacterized protein
LARVRALYSVVFVAAAAGALALPLPAFAHVTVSPSRVEAGERTLTFTVPNEFVGAEGRSRIDKVVIEAPAGVALGNVQAKPGWTAVVHGRTATWSGGSIRFRRYDTFGLDVEMPDLASDLVFRATEGFAVPRHVERYPVSVSLGAEPSSKGDHDLAITAFVVALAAAGLAAASFFFAIARWLRGA